MLVVSSLSSAGGGVFVFRVCSPVVLVGVVLTRMGG